MYKALQVLILELAKLIGLLSSAAQAVLPARFAAKANTSMAQKLLISTNNITRFEMQQELLW